MKEKNSPVAAIATPELWFIGQLNESEKEIIPETTTSFREYYY